MNLVDMYATAAEQYRKNRLEEQQKNSNANRSIFSMGNEVEAFFVAPDGERMSLGALQSVSLDVSIERSPIYTLGTRPAEVDNWIDSDGQ